MKGQGVLTTGEAAQFCGVSFRTVLRWIERGRIRAYKLPGRGDHRIRIEDFLEFLKLHDMPLPPAYREAKRRILVVDDDPATVRLLEEILRQAGYEPITAQNGFSAGAQLLSALPDAITLDLFMPGLAGEDVIRCVRSMPQVRHTRILVVSALSREQLDNALTLGADDAIGKPVDPDLLLRKLRTLLGASAGTSPRPGRS